MIFDNDDIVAAGQEIFLDGTTAGTSRYELGVVGAGAVGDMVVVEVVSARFSESPNNAFGYDDMDDLRGKLHHINVKSGDSTFVQLRLGGNFAAGLLSIQSEHPDALSINLPSPLQSEMDVRLDGTAGIAKSDGIITARLGDDKGIVIGAIGSHTYKEFFHKVAIWRIEDPISPATKLTSTKPDTQELEETVNAFLKPVVARVTITDANQGGPPIKLAYDIDKDGECDDTPDGQPNELNTLHALITPQAGFYIVTHVHQIRRHYLLGDEGNPGDMSVRMDDSIANIAGQTDSRPTMMLVGPNGSEEIRRTSRNLLTINFDKPLQNHYPIPGSFIELELKGLGGSPGTMADAEMPLYAFVLAHEICHALLDMDDVHQAADNLMDSDEPNIVGRLRFKKLTEKYILDPNTALPQRQWDRVPRT